MTFDPRWNDYVKTTFVQFRGEGWRCKEVDVPIGQVNDMSEDGVKPERSIMFIQPSAEFKTTAYYTAWQDLEGCDFDFIAFENVKSFRPDLENDKKLTMNKKQRALITKGEDQVRQQDEAMLSSLTYQIPYSKKILICVTMFASLFTTSAGHMAEIIDPGINANACTAEWRKILRARSMKLIRRSLSFMFIMTAMTVHLRAR